MRKRLPICHDERVFMQPDSMPRRRKECILLTTNNCGQFALKHVHHQRQQGKMDHVNAWGITSPPVTAGQRGNVLWFLVLVVLFKSDHQFWLPSYLKQLQVRLRGIVAATRSALLPSFNNPSSIDWGVLFHVFTPSLSFTQPFYLKLLCS